jgi:SPW repeat
MTTQNTERLKQRERFEQEQRGFEQRRRPHRFLAENRQQDWLTVLLAIWLFISPWVLQFGSGVPTSNPSAGGGIGMADVLYAASWNAWVLGVIVFLIALSASGRRATWEGSGGNEWVVLLLGVWVFVAPWVLGFANVGTRAAAWDHWVTGALIFLVSLWNLSTMPSITSSDRYSTNQR